MRDVLQGEKTETRTVIISLLDSHYTFRNTE